MILTSRRSAAIAVVGAVSLAACGGESNVATTGESPLVATTTIWADVTSHVACGESVTSIIPSGADPHTFESSLRDRELLERAGVVVANGADLEESLVDLLDTIADSDTTVVEVADAVDLITDESDADDPDHHGGVDPHLWLDPIRVIGALDPIADAVIAAGRDRGAIEACTTEYRDRLERLDAEVSRLLARIPADRRVLVTNHDALAYFADRYEFEVLGTVIPSTSTMAETNPAQLAALADTIAQHDVTAIFAEEIESSADATALADRLGVEVALLNTGSLGDAPPVDTYIGMMRANAETIAEALAT